MLQKGINEYINFSDIYDLWDDLYKKNENLTAFQSAEWALSVLNTYKKKKRMQVRFIVYSDICILPIVLCDKEIHLFGRFTCTDYLDIISFNFEKSNFLELLEYLKNRYKGFALYFEQLRENSRLKILLDEMDGFELYEKGDCVSIDLLDDYDLWYQERSKHYRQNRRTDINRLKKEQKSITFAWKNASELNKKELFELYNIYVDRRVSCNELDEKIEHKLKRKVSNYLKFDFYKDTINDYCLKKNSNCKLAILYIDNVIASYFIGIQKGNTLSVPRVSININSAKYSPGNLLIMEFVKHKAGEIKILDLTRGNEKYKYDNGGARRELYYYRKYL